METFRACRGCKDVESQIVHSECIHQYLRAHLLNCVVSTQFPQEPDGLEPEEQEELFQIIFNNERKCFGVMATTGDEGMLSHALESFKCPRCQYKYSTVTQKPATHKEDHQKACEIRKMWELFILHQMKRIMSSGMIATVCRQSSHSHFVIIALLTWLLLTTLNEQHVKNLIKLRNLNESDENSVLITVMNAAANQ